MQRLLAYTAKYSKILKVLLGTKIPIPQTHVDMTLVQQKVAQSSA
jgi:hypothetical protein